MNVYERLVRNAHPDAVCEQVCALDAPAFSYAVWQQRQTAPGAVRTLHGLGRTAEDAWEDAALALLPATLPTAS